MLPLDPEPVTMPSSFDALYREHAPAATRLALLLTGDAALAEDLVQDAFVRVAARHDVMRDRDAFGPYLTRAVANAAKSHFRHQYVVRKHAPRFAVVRVDAQPDTATRDMLWDALLQLPERQRAAIVLRYYEGLNEGEIAATLGCARGTVKAWLSRGLAKLRKVVDDA